MRSSRCSLGCGCGKRSSPSRRPALRPTIGPRSIVGGTAAGATPAQIRAVGLRESTSLGQTRRLDEKRLQAERARRAAINKKLGK